MLSCFLPITEKYGPERDDNDSKRIISFDQATSLTKQLHHIRKQYPHTIHDQTDFEEANRESYYARITQQIKTCDGLYAFRVNNSDGVGFAIQKAKGKLLDVKEYTIEDQSPTPRDLIYRLKNRTSQLKRFFYQILNY